MPGLSADLAVVLVHCEEPILASRQAGADGFVAFDGHIGMHPAELRVLGVQLAKSFDVLVTDSGCLLRFERPFEIERPFACEGRQKTALAGCSERTAGGWRQAVAAA